MQNVDLLKLEEQFKQIDKQSRSVKVQVTGEEESSAKVSVSAIESEPPPVGGSGDGGSEAKAQPGGEQEETLLNLDLSKINVPDEYIEAKMAKAFTAPMCGTIAGVKVSQIGAGADYVVVEDYTYDGGAYQLTVLSGFTYDRASIPRVFWVLIDKDSLGNVAPLVHDLLYRSGGVLPQTQVSPYRKFSRKETDDLFLEVMTKCGVAEWRRAAAYQAVRRFAGRAWKGD